MLYEQKLTDTQVEKYLKRLELTRPDSIDLSALDRLLFAQLTHIPFDSLDVWATGCCPSLDLNDIYDKIVRKDRGGYCFELNTLFRALLNALGFDACQVVARILSPDGTPQPPAHNVILSTVEGKRYFLDVGYGGPVPYRALELTEGLADGFLLSLVDDTWFVYRQTASEQRPLICFRDIPVGVDELIPLNFYISQRPDSHFRHLIHLSKRNCDGSIYAMDGNEFKIHAAEGVCVRKLYTIDDVKEIMSTYFGMDPNSVPFRNTLE